MLTTPIPPIPEGKQIRLLDVVAKSWQINSKSAKSNDGGYYSLLVNNCGSWAIRMIKHSGLQIPDTNMNLGTGLGYGMDWTGLPQAVYYPGRGAVDAYDFTKDQSGQFADAFREGWGFDPKGPPLPDPSKPYVGFWEALERGWGFK